MPRIQMNKVMLAGNLTDTPTFKKLNETTSVCNASLVINTRVSGTDENGKPKEKQMYIDITAWNDVATRLSERSKGDNVLIEGELDLEIWGDDTAPKRKHKVNARTVKFIFGKEVPKTEVAAEDVLA